MANKLRIGIDVDDTFFECLSHWVEYIHIRTDIPYSELSKMLDGGFHTFYKEVEQKTGIDVISWWDDDKLYCRGTIKPKPMAAQIVRQWIDDPRIDVTFITSSMDSHVASKDMAIEYHVNRSSDLYTIVHEKEKWKHEFDVFIDDAEHNVVAYHNHHPFAFILCPRMAINKSFCSGMGAKFAVDDWLDIADKVGEVIKFRFGE